MQEIIDVIVPVYNEEEILPEFYNRLQSLKLSLHVIFIDNASTDHTIDVISEFKDVQLIRHKNNEGYGGSIIDGLHHSTNKKIIIIDADCEYQPEIIPNLVAALNKDDVVYASRFLTKNQYCIPLAKRIGNKSISSLFNILFQQKITDLYTGCKAIQRSALQDIHLQRKGFEHVLELAAKLARRDVTIKEIPIDFTPRRTGKAKMKHLQETIKYFYYMVYYHFTIR